MMNYETTTMNIKREERDTFENKMNHHLVCLGSKFKVWTLDDCIYRACLLAKPAVDALGHIDVVPMHSSIKQSIDGNKLVDSNLYKKITRLYLVVRRLPSSRSSASIVIACAGQICTHNITKFSKSAY